MTTQTMNHPALRSRVLPLRPMPLLVALVAVDLALVAASVVRLVVAGHSFTDPWLLETDGGWAEVFGYVQQGAIALLLLVLAVLTRRLVFVPWAALFAFALADDSLRLHENKGAWLAEMLDRKLWFPDSLLGLRANDLGEMIVWGLLAVAPLAAVALLHRRGDAWTRRAGVGLAVLTAAYVFFGAVVDQFHVLFLDSWLGDVVGTVEDGGELIVLSVVVVYVVGRIASARRRPERLLDEDRAPVATLTAPGAHAAS
jgi:hypothetical protein